MRNYSFTARANHEEVLKEFKKQFSNVIFNGSSWICPVSKANMIVITVVGENDDLETRKIFNRISKKVRVIAGYRK